MPSIMAGLCCGEPNILGWDILRNHDRLESCLTGSPLAGIAAPSAPLEKGDRASSPASPAPSPRASSRPS